MKYLQVKKWDEFQHYKDRNPPWIKLYNYLLEDYDFSCLSDSAKGQLICIWMLASRTKNKIPYDNKWVARKISASSQVDLLRLEEAGWLEPWGQSEEEEWPSRYIKPELRSKIFDRDGNKCNACGEKKNLEVDHIIPVSKGGEGVEENLQILCRSCNRRKRTKLTEQVATQVCSLEGETEGEDIKKSRVEDCSEPKTPASEPQPKPIISIPTNRKNTEHPITQNMVTEWIELFPNVDVLPELRKMRAWALANVAKRKTAKGMERFVVAWLSKEQDKGKGNGGGNTNGSNWGAAKRLDT